MSDFYLVAGLGNPGREYTGTRHNVGFETLDVLMEKAGLDTDKMKTFGRGLIAGGRIDGEKVMFLKPVTYMNRSGDSVREVVEYYRIDPETRLIVICDDIYLDPGAIRIRKSGSDGGHNGLKSVISGLGGRSFIRVRLGVGDKPAPEADLAAHVLSRFSGEDAKIMEKTYERAADAIVCMMTEGIDAAMNKYNRSGPV